jgi:flagellar biosynthesis protein FliR
MMSASLIDALQPIRWPTLALVSARTAGLVMVAPLWSLSAIPASLRGGIAMLLAFVILPSVPTALDPADGTLVLAAGGELLVGLALGLSAAVFTHGLTVAAEVVSLQMGLSLGAALNPAADLGSPGIGELKMLLGLAVYTGLGGHLMLVSALARSFESLPPGTAPDLAGGSAVVALLGTVFDVAIRAAAPAMVALLLANIALALLNRAVPQLNTMMVAMPVTIAVGLLALGASLPTLTGWAAGWTSGIGARADLVIRSFVAPVVGGR